jgi:hypothetical protein
MIAIHAAILKQAVYLWSLRVKCGIGNLSRNAQPSIKGPFDMFGPSTEKKPAGVTPWLLLAAAGSIDDTGSTACRGKLPRYS